MPVSFDPAKSERNQRERGLSFELVDRLDWSTALVKEDERRDYGETRLLVFGLIDQRLHVAVVTPRGEDLRVISLRKANRKEERLYGQETQRPSRTPG